MSNIRKTISYIKRNGLKKTSHMIIQRLRENKADESYGERRCLEAVTVAELKVQREYVFKERPLISIVVPAYETNEDFLKQLLDSVLLQSYENFELIIADASKSRVVREVLSEYDDERLRYHQLKSNAGISGNSNEGLKAAKGSIVTFLDHDDFLEPDALFYIAKAFEDGARLVYTDEDKYNGSIYFKANRKPDFDLDLLLSNNYICHLFAADIEMVRQMGGFRPEYDGAQDYDLILRCAEKVMLEYKGENLGGIRAKIVHIPRVLYHWRVHPDSTAENPDAKLYAYEAGLLAVKDYYDRRSILVNEQHTEHRGFYIAEYLEETKDELRYTIPEGYRALTSDYKKLCKGFFIRPEVKAVVFRCLDANHKVMEDPYRGMSRYDSGLMHRAHMRQNMTALSGECYCERKNGKGELIVYAPDILFSVK